MTYWYISFLNEHKYEKISQVNHSSLVKEVQASLNIFFSLKLFVFVIFCNSYMRFDSRTLNYWMSHPNPYDKHEQRSEIINYQTLAGIYPIAVVLKIIIKVQKMLTILLFICFRFIPVLLFSVALIYSETRHQVMNYKTNFELKNMILK